MVAVLVDNSTSMLKHQDSLKVRNDLMDEIALRTSNWPDADVQFFNFDADVRLGEVDFSGEETDIARALKTVKQKIPEGRLAAILLVSDGIVNRGSNPLYEAENLFIPIYTLAVGDTTPHIDLSVAQVRAPEFAFRGDDVEISITVAAQNANGRSLAFSLLLGNQIIQQKKINVTDDAFASVISTSVAAKNVGMMSFTAQIAELPEERNKLNNSQRFTIEVIENRKKIAVLAHAPHPDVSAVREALKQVDAYDVRWLKADETPDKDIELAIIFVQPGTQPSELSNQIKNYKGPVWLMIDPGAPAKALMLFPNIGISESGTMLSRLSPNRDFGQFGLSNECKQWMQNLPELFSPADVVEVQGTFETLFKNSRSATVAEYGTYNGNKMVVMQMSGLWQWRIHNYKIHNHHRYFDEWMQVSTQFATQDSKSNRLRLQYQKRVTSGTPFSIIAEVYDAAFQPSPNANISLRIKNESGDATDYALPYKNDRYETSITALKPGFYDFEATARLGSEELKSKGALVVEQVTLEDLDTRANHPMLRQISLASGGQFRLAFTNEQIEKTEAIDMPKIEQLNIRSIPLIELKWLFFAVLLIFSAEWVLRRYFGNI